MSDKNEQKKETTPEEDFAAAQAARNQDTDDDVLDDEDEIPEDEGKKDDEPAPKDEGKKDDESEEEGIWADAPESLRNAMEELKESHAALERRAQSDSGRVRAFQKKYENALRDLRAKDEAQIKAPSTDEILKAARGTSEEWNSFEEDYPEIASAVSSMVGKALEQNHASTSKVLDAKIQGIASAVSNESEEAVSLVAEVHGADWTKQVTSAEFNTWIGSQPDGVKKLYDSDDPSDVIELLDQYNEYSEAQQDESGKDDSSDEPAKKDDGGSAPANKKTGASQRSSEELEDVEGIESTKAGVKPTDVDDDGEDAIDRQFDHFRKKRERRAKTG